MPNTWKVTVPPKVIPHVIDEKLYRIQLEDLAKILYHAFKNLNSSTESGLQKKKESQ